MKQASLLSMVVALFFCVCSPVLLGAQTTLGFRTGMNLATFGGGPIGSSYEYRGGLNIGAYLDLSVSEKIGLQIGAGYTEKGADLSLDTPLGTLDWENSIGYLEIPVLLRVELARISRVSPQILFGPALSMTTSCEWKTRISGSPLRISCDDPGYEIRSVDFGAIGGLSLKVALSDRVALAGDSFYAFGLRPVGEGRDSVRNRAFSVSLGLALLLG